MLEFKCLFQLWWNKLKAEVSVKVWKPVLRVCFDLFSCWKIALCCNGNQERSWCHLHLGPFLFGVEWDLDPQS